MNDTAILAAILGMTDAIHLPLRNWTRPAPQNTAAARRDFIQGGVAWRPGASSEGQRKSTERELAAMADRGIISVHRRSGLRWPMVKLSDEADWQTRSLCGLPGKEGAWLVARELLKQSEVIPSWIPDRALMGDNPDRFEAVAIENMLLPLLVRGYVQSGSTVNGEARYLLTESGAAWLGSMKRPSPDSDKSDPAACRIYDATIQNELHRLQTEKIQDSRELGMIPLPCGDHPPVKKLSPRHCAGKNTGIVPEKNRRATPAKER